MNFHEKNNLTSYNALPPRMYFLPKRHKPGIPLRPVTSFVGSALYNLSRSLAKILSQLKTAEHNAKNSYEFFNKKNKSHIPASYIMTSFDVCSLFTNVPVDLAYEMLQSRWAEISTKTTLQRNDFLGLLDLCTNNSYFVYNDVYYKQIFGVPMGSPLSSILANIVMDRVLEQISLKGPTRD